MRIIPTTYCLPEMKQPLVKIKRCFIFLKQPFVKMKQRLVKI
jgi:hypothetical protein